MIIYVKLFILELKKMLRFLPRLMAGALALCLIIGSIGYGASELLYKNEGLVKTTIAVVTPGEDIYIDLMMSIINEMESVKKNCKFVEVDEVKAYKMVEDGEAFAAIVFPKRFVQDIVYGKNTPAKVVIGKENTIEGALFEELATAGTEMLSAVQAGVYTVISEYSDKTGERIVNNSDIIKNINLEYIDFILPRKKYFKATTYSATGRLTPPQYYTVMGVVLFMLMLGVGLGKLIIKENKSFYEKINVAGVNEVGIYIVKTMMISIIYIIFAIIAVLATKMLGLDIVIGLKEIGVIFLSIWLVSSIVVAFFTVINSIVPASLSLFIISTIMCFISGVFLPIAFLPNAVSNLAEFLPTSTVARLLSNIFVPDYRVDIFISYAIMLIAVYLLIVLFSAIKRFGGVIRT